MALAKAAARRADDWTDERRSGRDGPLASPEIAARLQKCARPPPKRRTRAPRAIRLEAHAW